jgi:hypothetical protein
MFVTAGALFLLGKGPRRANSVAMEGEPDCPHLFNL